MRRLALVGPTRVNSVIRTNRDVQLFLQIPIEIPKKNTGTAVRILEPALIGGRYVLTRLVQRLHGQLSGLPARRQRHAHERPACEQNHKTQCCHRRPQRVHPRNLLLPLNCVLEPDFLTACGKKRKTVILSAGLARSISLSPEFRTRRDSWRRLGASAE